MLSFRHRVFGRQGPFLLRLRAEVVTGWLAVVTTPALQDELRHSDERRARGFVPSARGLAPAERGRGRPKRSTPAARSANR